MAGCRSCAEQRQAFKRALRGGQVVRAAKIAVEGAQQIVRDVVAPPRRTKSQKPR